MKDWIKRKLGISALETENARLRQRVENHERFVSAKVAELKEYTRVDADIGVRGNNTIILTGVYRGTAFVRFYDVGDGEFIALVEQLRSMKDHALIRNVDAPAALRASFEV